MTQLILDIFFVCGGEHWNVTIPPFKKSLLIGLKKIFAQDLGELLLAR